MLAHVWLAHLAEERGDAAAARRLRSVLRQRWPLCDEAGPVDALPDGYSDWRRQPAPGLGGGPWQREARFYAWAGRNARLRSVLRSLLRRGRAGPEAVAALIYAELARGRSQAARHLVRMHGASLGREGTRAGALLPLSYPVRFVDEVREAAHAAGVPAELLAAVVRHESGFDPQARSSVGARGLTQLMPRTARAMAKRYMPDMPDAKKRWREPAINLQLGAHVLARLLERYKGDAGLALIAYASGPGRLAGALKGTEELPRPLRLDAVPLGQTVGYARRVLTARNIYRALLGNDLAAAASPIEGP